MVENIEKGMEVKIHTGYHFPPIRGEISNIIGGKLYVKIQDSFDLNIEVSKKTTLEFALEKNAAHLCSGYIESLIQIDSSVIVISNLSPLERYQRRGFVRVPASLRARCSVRNKRIEAMILNISGSGALLCTKEELLSDDIIRLKFDLPLQQKTKINVEARIAREAMEKIEGAPWDYKYGVEFLNIPQSLQDRIVSYTFKKLTNNL